MHYHLMQPVKIIDPHLVSSFFDGYKRVYLHATTELVNRSAWVAECSLNIQVTTELEGSMCLVEHLQTQHVSIPVGSQIQYTFPQVGLYNAIENIYILVRVSKRQLKMCNSDCRAS